MTSLASKQPAASEAEKSTAAPVAAVPLAASRLGNERLHQLLRARLVQPKLEVSRPNDPLEQEADRLAREGASMDKASPAVSAGVQRACSTCEEEELNRKSMDAPLTVSRVSESPAGGPALDESFETAVRSLPTRGAQPLPGSVHPFVQRLGLDPGAVRVHMDADLARRAEAKAFTHGSDIVFNPAHFAPGTQSGDELIRHECVHVAQQGKAATAIQRQPADDSVDLRTLPPLPTSGPFAILSSPTPDEIVRNLNNGRHADGTPLSAAEWRERRRKGDWRAPDGVVRFADTGEIVTNDKLLHWAENQTGTVEDIIRNVTSSSTFIGPTDLLAQFAKTLGGPLEARRRQQEEARLREEAENSRFALHQHQLKAEMQRARLVSIKNHRDKVTSAMAALRSAGPAAEISAIYHDLRTVDGKTHELMTEKPGLDRILKDSLRSSTAQRLKLQRLTIAEFGRLVSGFEESFRAATQDMALAALDAARDRALEFRDGFRKVDALAREVVRDLYPVRAPLIALFHRASVLDADASEAGGRHLIREEADATRKQAVDLTMFALDGLPFIRLPDFPLEKVLRTTDPNEVRHQIVDFLDGYVRDIRTTRELLVKEPDQIYRLDVLLARAKRDLGIERGSIFDTMLLDAAKDAAESSWPDKLKTLLMFAVLAASVLVPGGAVATGAAVVGAGIAVHDAVQAIGEYKQDHAAFGAGLRSADPSLVWVVVSLIGAALAAAGAGALLRSHLAESRLKAAAERFGRIREVEQLSRDLAEVPGLSAEARAAIEARARALKSVLQQRPSGGQHLFETMDEAGFAALLECNATSIAEVREYGGVIYQTSDGRYGYTKPVQGGFMSVDPFASPAPPGTKVVGEYHTHGDYADGVIRVDGNWVANRTTAEFDTRHSDFYADNDLHRTLRKGWEHEAPDYASYLGTPSGDFFKATISHGPGPTEPIIRWLDPDLFIRR